MSGCIISSSAALAPNSRAQSKHDRNISLFFGHSFICCMGVLVCVCICCTQTMNKAGAVTALKAVSFGNY